MYLSIILSDENGKPIGYYKCQATDEKEDCLYPPRGGPNEFTDLPSTRRKTPQGKSASDVKAPTGILVVARGNLNKKRCVTSRKSETPGQDIN